MRCAAAIACWAALALVAPAARAAPPWKLVGPPAPPTSLAFTAAAGSGRVFAKAGGTWLRSDDHGATWTAGGDPVCDLRVAPANPDAVYSGCGQVSLDAGAHWSALAGIAGPPQIDAAGALYEAPLGTGFLNRCTPSGSSCAHFDLHGAGLAAVDPASSGLVVAIQNGLIVSTDGGATFSAPHAWPAGITVPTVTFDGTTPRTLILTGADGADRAFKISADAGATWGPTRHLPFPHDSWNLVYAGGRGALHRTWVLYAGDAVWTDDAGATFHAVHLPMRDGTLTVDPADGRHLFLGDAQQLSESHDAGATWTLRNSAQFGHLGYQELTGSGSTLYATTERLAWLSHDAGETWRLAADLRDAKIGDLLASRDDANVAYAASAHSTVAAFWQTVDGGETWQARPPPPMAEPTIGWIESGHPDRVFAGGSQLPLVGSHDGGRTWSPEPLASTCVLTVAWAPGSSTRGQAGCGGGSLFSIDPLRAPWDQAFGAAPGLLVDHAGGGSLVSLDPLGRVGAGWSFASACMETMWKGTCASAYAADNDLRDAWASGGRITYAYANGLSVLAKIDGSRWWRMARPPGSDAIPQPYPRPLVFLSHTTLIANGLRVTLAAPEAPPPVVAQRGPALYCTVALAADEADVSYAWRRDGAPIAGTRTDHPFVTADLGHALTCVVTASNDWGATTLVSDPWRVPPTAPVATTSALTARLALSGSASTGQLLRCGAAKNISWLRDGRVVKGRHARTYRVRVSDEGHALACQSRSADGGVAQSDAVRVPRGRGGAAAVMRR